MSAAKSRRRPARIAEAPANRLLLDTHVWLWWQTQDPRLGKRTRATISNAADVRLSVASVWEIIIKRSSGKLQLRNNADIKAELDTDGFRPLAIDLQHVLLLQQLPVHHKDPFDRILAAQALAEGLTLVTADASLRRYQVPMLLATE